MLIDNSDVCESEGDNCLWKKDAHGTATLNIAPYSQGDDVWKTGAYFVCFGTSQENLTKGVVQRCRSFSSFFTFQPPAQPAVPGLKARQGGSPVDLKSLVVPTSALQLFHTTDIVHQPGAAITPAPTTSSAASSSSSSSTQEGSLYTKVLTGSDGSLTTQVVFSKSSSTVTVSPTSTGTPISSPSKGKSGLPMGAIIGIAIGGAAILFAILVFAFLCYRRRRRAKTPSEQVLLAENMKHHPQSLEKLEVDISNHSANSGMLGSILETRPSSGPYDHVQSSAPYSGPLGPHRRTLSSQLAVAPAPATLSRGPSDASIQTPVSPSTIPGNDARSLNRRSIDARSVSIYDEPYQDIPLYGDARHMPQVYNSQNLPFLSQSPTPFLSEPGMSQEEIERLEEEERRIDAAIAEAERRR